MSDTPLLQIDNLHVYYESSHILQGISLRLEQGVIALVGRNGMGKTTLVKAVMGLVPVHSGRLLLNGEDITNLKPYQIAMRNVGYVPQGRGLFESLTVDEHLQVPARRGSSGGWNADRVYDLFPRLRKRTKQYATSLSGGEQQMLAIGRALVTNPSLLLMDEPSEGLAPVIIDLLIQNLRSLTESGLSILLIEQNLRTASSLVDELYVVVAGRIVEKVNSKLLLHDQKLREQYLGVRIQKSA
jgi:branched-chain amino acid transport system ATP-binding protein